MGALNAAAQHVNTAWCKGNLRLEESAKNSGDAFCAVGALGYALLGQDQFLTSDGNFMGPLLEVMEYDAERKKYVAARNAYNAVIEHSPETDGLYSNLVAARKKWAEASKVITDRGNFVEVYDAVGDTEEGRTLARVIMENFPDRLPGYTDSAGDPIDPVLEGEENHVYHIIYSFNDHPDTLRDEVVAMMEKADQRLEDERLARELAEDDLVADIDTLLDEPANV